MQVFDPSDLLDLFGEPVRDRIVERYEDPFDDYLKSELWDAKLFRIFMLSDKDPSKVHFLERATCGDGVFIWVFTMPKWRFQTSSDGRLNLTGTCIYTPKAEDSINRITKHYEESDSYTEIEGTPDGIRAWHKEGMFPRIRRYVELGLEAEL
ncbi:uncharacterized protein Triagg1_251 [Trichoderma aggressivum f. europaeum]|uniref:Uncharacterized protein n=1 Tax=Trichoderma aggressivum f. europaeum TaxID=173218 RepID=A0AAE1IL35_9HYPO|nr:hypothetical protein Triagg1_251 [Trichoderma aggressivum f. europaeum]